MKIIQSSYICMKLYAFGGLRFFLNWLFENLKISFKRELLILAAIICPSKFCKLGILEIYWTGCYDRWRFRLLFFNLLIFNLLVNLCCVLIQATLGLGSSTERCILQCLVGHKNPIFLCSLLPDKNECCPLNLEFENDDLLAFSVIGPRSIHVSGYFVADDGGLIQDDYELYPFD